VLKQTVYNGCWLVYHMSPLALWLLEGQVKSNRQQATSGNGKCNFKAA